MNTKNEETTATLPMPKVSFERPKRNILGKPVSMRPLKSILKGKSLRPDHSRNIEVDVNFTKK